MLLRAGRGRIEARTADLHHVFEVLLLLWAVVCYLEVEGLALHRSRNELHRHKQAAGNMATLWLREQTVLLKMHLLYPPPEQG